MITQLLPWARQQSSIIRSLLDLLTGFVIVYVIKRILILYSRSLLKRRHTAQQQKPAPILHLRDVPGPKAPSWLWGSEWEKYSSAPGQKYLEWYRQFGRIFKFRGALGTSFLSLADPAAIHHILGHQNCYQFPKPDGERQFFECLLGKGIIWAEGEAHMRQRRILGPAFSQQALRVLSSIFLDSAHKTAAAWTRLIDATPVNDALIDVQCWANHISLDTIGLAGFSHDFKTLDPSQPQHPLARTLDGFTDSSAIHSFSAFLVHSFLWAFPAILRIPSGRQKALARSRQTLAMNTDRVWAERKRAGQDGQDGQDAGKSIIEILLRAEKGNSSRLDKEEIAAEMSTLIFGGYETTAATIAWILYELALHPDYQAAVRAEVSASSGDPSYDDLHSGFPLLSAAINETLRVHPVVLQVHREAAKDCLVPLAALQEHSPKRGLQPQPHSHLFIPRGTIIVLPVNVMQSAEDVWGPDAGKWNPSRWTEINAKESNEKHQDWRRELMVFSTGARGCIGRAFAILEIKAVLAILLRQFVFAPDDDKEIEPLLSFMVRPRVKGESKISLPLRVSRVVD